MTIIVVGDKTYTTSLEPTEAAEAHEHDEIPMDDSNLKDGQIILKAHPPPDGKYIWVQNDVEDVFTVETDGIVHGKGFKTTGGMETLGDAKFAHKYSNNTAEDNNFIRMGRQQNKNEPLVGLLDGILHKRTIDGQVHEYMQQLHPSWPKIDIRGTTEDNVDWLRITDDVTGDPVFAVHSDGTLECGGWGSVEIDLPDGYSGSHAVGSESLYVGDSKLALKNGRLQISHLKVPPYIPKKLTEYPWELTVNNINPLTIRSINDWMRLARSSYGDATEAKGLRIRDIFPHDNLDDDFEVTEGYPNTLSGKVILKCDTLVCDIIKGKTGESVGRFKVRNLLVLETSMWMGERLHISTDSGRALMLYRKENLPAYLVALGVDEADVLAIPSTLATLTLQQIEDLSVAASGSADLS